MTAAKDLFEELLSASVTEDRESQLANAFNICLVAAQLRNGTAPENVFTRQEKDSLILVLDRYKDRVRYVDACKEEESYELLVYHPESEHVPTEDPGSPEKFGRFLGLLCPGQLDGDYAVSFFLQIVGDAGSRDSFYAENCDELTPAHRLEFKARLDSINEFVLDNDLPLRLSLETGRSWQSEKSHFLLNDPSLPLRGDDLAHLSNLLSGSGCETTVKIIESLLADGDADRTSDYRSLVQGYLPIWTALLAFQAVDPFDGLFDEDSCEAIAGAVQDYPTWESVEARLVAWEKQTYQALGFKFPWWD